MNGWRLAAIVYFASFLATPCAARQSDQSAAATDEAPLAIVNGKAIATKDVHREIDRALAERNLPKELAPSVRQALAAQTLELLVERRLALDALRRQRRAASEADIDAEAARRERELARQNLALADELKRQGQTLAELRAELEWQLSWQRYVDAELTGDAVRKHFEENRRHFDGTQLRVSHILFALPNEATAEDIQAAKEKAARVRGEIVQKKITFAEAAARESAAPTKASGGEIGFITRHGEQHENFARGAFSLAKGEISEPVSTPRGVHLIVWTEEKPGERRLAEVEGEVRQAAATGLFHALAQAERSRAKIEYPGK